VFSLFWLIVNAICFVTFSNGNNLVSSMLLLGFMIIISILISLFVYLENRKTSSGIAEIEAGLYTVCQVIIKNIRFEAGYNKRLEHYGYADAYGKMVN